MEGTDTSQWGYGGEGHLTVGLWRGGTPHINNCIIE